MENKNAVLKIIGIMLGIIVVCIILSLLVGVPAMKNMKYKNAVSNAEKENYSTAVSELSGKSMDNYKDVKSKRQEYAIEAAKQYIELNDTDNAIYALEYCISEDSNSAYAESASEMMKEIKKDK